MTASRFLSTVIFDMDGLLLDNQHEARSSWQQALGEHGYILTDEHYADIAGGHLDATRDYIFNLFGPSLDFDAIFARRKVLGRDAELRDGVKVKAGVIDLLAELDVLHLKKAVATNTDPERTNDRLARAGIDKRFDLIFTADGKYPPKPAPDIYLAAAMQLGVSPSDCLVFEDSEIGMLAGCAAGMKVILVPDMKPPSDQAKEKAYKVLSSLSQAIEVVRASAKNW